MFSSSGFSLFSLPLHTDRQINKSLHVRQTSWLLKMLFHIPHITDLEKIFLIAHPVWNVFHLKCCLEKFSVPRQCVTSHLMYELTLFWKNQYKHKCLVQSLRSPIWEVTFLTRQLGKGIFFSSEPQISSQCTSTLQRVRLRFLTYAECTPHQVLATTNPTDQNPVFLNLKSPVYELNISLRRGGNKFVFQWNIGMPPA